MPYIDFKAVKAAIPIDKAAKLLGLEVTASATQLRGPCPACGNDDPRILAITPAKGVFFCHDKQVGGDCISLAAHILSLSMKDAAEWLQETIPHAGQEPTVPPAKEAKKEVVFDATAFASKLVYAEEVKARGITEADAKRFSIGLYRGLVYFPVRDDNGFIAGFIGVNEKGELKVPKTWLTPSNVVALKRA
jgi:hypothetical protein